MKRYSSILCFLLFTTALNAQAIFSRNGYPEHFIAGTLIGGTVSYLSYRHNGNKVTSWILGFTAATLAGGIKEWIDPGLLGRRRDPLDFVYTGLGGVLGASIVIPLNSRPRSRGPVGEKSGSW